MAADERFDGLFLNMAQQAGSIDNIFDAFFGFLGRKTDFYVGCANKKDALDMVTKAFDKHYEKALESKKKSAEESKKLDEERKRRAETQKKTDEEEYQKRMKKEDPKIEEVSDDAVVGVVKEEETLLPKEGDNKVRFLQHF